jgi:hypothetical protein
MIQGALDFSGQQAMDLDGGSLRSQSARDARDHGYGGPAYWSQLDKSAAEHFDYFTRKGDHVQARLMFTRSLSEALKGNDGL